MARYEREVIPEPNVPDLTLIELLHGTAREYGAHTATLFYGERLTYVQLYEQTVRFSAALRGLGIERGERVALLLPNCPQFVVALFGALDAGCVAVPLNPLMGVDELSDALRESGATVVVALQTAESRVREASSGTGAGHLIITGLQEYLSPIMSLALIMRERREVKGTQAQPQVEGEGGSLMAHRFLDLVRQSASSAGQEHDTLQAQPEDLALLLYTEGVTADSKVVKLSHRNVIANICQIGTWLWDSRPERRDVYLSAVPFYTGYGLLAALLLPVWVAGTMVVLPRPTPKELVRALARCRPTVFPSTPILLAGLATHPLAQRQDIRSLRVCLSSGDSLLPETARAIEELTGARVAEAYGLTEAAGITHCNPIYGERREGSIGLPLPLTDACILDNSNGGPLPADSIGELAVKGPQVMQGYWKGTEATERVLRDGWLLTGDLARCDSDGYFYILARDADVIAIGGQRVYPREVESALLQNDKVGEALVVGVPNPRKEGEAAIVAYVVLKDDAEATERELIRSCSDYIPEYALPTRIEFREDLQRSPLGKYLRNL